LAGASSAGGRRGVKMAGVRISKAQRALLAMMKAHNGQVVTEATILQTTGWKQSAWRVYRGGGRYLRFLRPTAGGDYSISVPQGLTEGELVAAVSQSPARAASPVQNKLARALAARSRENMLLALELYNRPSLTNRLDGFCILFCVAWEQLLKAEIIERDGEAAAFRAARSGRRRESISLEECIGAAFALADPVAANLRTIAELRHQATHLVMAELQGQLARVFQAGLLNFAHRFQPNGYGDFRPANAVGLMCLVADERELDPVALRSSYGQRTAREMVDLAQRLRAEEAAFDDRRFSVRLSVLLAVPAKGDVADLTLTRAIDGAREAVIVEKPVDVDRVYPHTTSRLVEALREQYPGVTQHTVLALVHRESWKNGDNQFHRHRKDPDTAKYSEKALERLRVLFADAPLVAAARASYARYRRPNPVGGTGRS
jgi:hypothetical protein